MKFPQVLPPDAPLTRNASSYSYRQCARSISRITGGQSASTALRTTRRLRTAATLHPAKIRRIRSDHSGRKRVDDVIKHRINQGRQDTELFY
ncbi:hypothetical protein MFLAVUS_010254 [Mucor flavus]|uniref:Uncharacterized protein n=1 Tax=Mucor flavus TaxID=439312 RepID=A0ABP9ZC88_9FUNG